MKRGQFLRETCKHTQHGAFLVVEIVSFISLILGAGFMWKWPEASEDISHLQLYIPAMLAVAATLWFLAVEGPLQIIGELESISSAIEKERDELRNKMDGKVPTVIGIEREPEIVREPGAEHSYFRLRVRHESGPACLVRVTLESARPEIPAIPLDLEFTHPTESKFVKTLYPGSKQLVNVFIDRPKREGDSGYHPTDKPHSIRLMGAHASEVDIRNRRYTLKIVARPEYGEPAVKHFNVDYDNGLRFYMTNTP